MHANGESNFERFKMCIISWFSCVGICADDRNSISSRANTIKQHRMASNNEPNLMSSCGVKKYISCPRISGHNFCSFWETQYEKKKWLNLLCACRHRTRTQHFRLSYRNRNQMGSFSCKMHEINPLTYIRVYRLALLVCIILRHPHSCFPVVFVRSQASTK